MTVLSRQKSPPGGAVPTPTAHFNMLHTERAGCTRLTVGLERGSVVGLGMAVDLEERAEAWAKAV